MKLRILLALTLASANLTLHAGDIDELAWMTGYWTAMVNEVAQEELWSSSAGNMMLGLHRDVSADGSGSFEFMQIVERQDGIFYRASPQGRPAVEFKLVEVTDRRVTFENLTHDFPQRIIYERSGETMIARIEDKIGKKGMNWVWTRSAFEATP